MNKKELKEWLEKNVDGIYISNDGLIRREDGWRIINMDKLMTMTDMELKEYMDGAKFSAELWNKVYEIIIRTLEYKLKKEVME